MDQTTETVFGTPFDVESGRYLASAGKWAKFIGIVGLIFAFFFLLMGLFAGAMLSSIFSSMNSNSPMQLGAGMVGAIYIIIGLIYIIPCIFLVRFGSKAQAAIRNSDLVAMHTSLRNLRSFFAFLGIMTIVVLAIYLIAIIAIIGMGVMNR